MSSKERQKLEEIVANSTLGGPIMEAADAYARASNLEGHAALCSWKRPDHSACDHERDCSGFVMRRCGEDGVYCPDAPVKEVTHHPFCGLTPCHEAGNAGS